MVYCKCVRCGHGGELKEIKWCTGGNAYFCSKCGLSYIVKDEGAENNVCG